MTGKDDDIWLGDGWSDKLLLGYARRVPAHPAKIRLFQLLARYVYGSRLAVRNRSGVRLRIDPLDYIGHAICFTGHFEPLSIALARRLMSEGGTFLDVGANFGLFTCSLLSDTSVDCIAVEASALAFTRLQHNLELNRAARVTALNAALSAARALVRLETPLEHNLGTTRVASEVSPSFPGGLCVAALSLDELLQLIGAQNIRLMKIDVEGYEIEVLRGLNFNCSYAPQNIIMEYSHRVAEAEDLDSSFRLLSDQGYRPFTVTGEHFDRSRCPLEENLWWRRAS
jgi:FkbM family methyltransferase